ncbi:MAG TPA: hypothetical protein VIF62_05840 [Labilithrix sp.]
MRRAFVLLALLAACDEKKPPPAPAPSASAALPVPPIPEFAAVAKIVLRQEQAGPLMPRCGGVVAELTIDLAQGEFDNAICTNRDAGDPWTVDHGKLTDAATKRIEKAWDLIHAQPSECMEGGGPVVLVVTTKDGASKSWVDKNWGCKKPSPPAVFGIGELGNEIRLALVKKKDAG